MASDSPAKNRSETSPAPASAGVVLDDLAIQRALTRIAHEIVERNEDLGRLYLVGIPNGGPPLARQIARNLREIAGVEVTVGVLDTTLYRDDRLTSGEVLTYGVADAEGAYQSQEAIPRGQRYSVIVAASGYRPIISDDGIAIPADATNPISVNAAMRRGR